MTLPINALARFWSAPVTYERDIIWSNVPHVLYRLTAARCASSCDRTDRTDRTDPFDHQSARSGRAGDPPLSALDAGHHLIDASIFSTVSSVSGMRPEGSR